MKSKLLRLITILIFLFPLKAHADPMGGDVAVLSQILVQTVNQLTELKKVVGTANEHVIPIPLNNSLNLCQRSCA